MDISALARPEVVYESLRLWTFPFCQPSVLEFRRTGGGGTAICCRTKDVEERHDIGVLELCPPPSATTTATFEVLGKNVRILASRVFAVPKFDDIGAARFELATGELWVAAAATHNALAVRLGARQWGKPERDWNDYVRAQTN
jgi:hypothetical protein